MGKRSPLPGQGTGGLETISTFKGGQSGGRVGQHIVGAILPTGAVETRMMRVVKPCNEELFPSSCSSSLLDRWTGDETRMAD